MIPSIPLNAQIIEQIPLVCPQCRAPGPDGPCLHRLELKQVLGEKNGRVMEGFLCCANPACGCRYPILEGVPIVLKNLAGWWRQQNVTGIPGQCHTGEMAAFCADLQVQGVRAMGTAGRKSAYLEAHYPLEPFQDDRRPMKALNNEAFWAALIKLAATGEPAGRAFALDMGCGPGRYTFELARRGHMAVGIDLDFDLVRTAAALQREGAVAFALQISRKRFKTVRTVVEPAERALFMVADAMDPPFPAEAFDLVAGLNLLDNVTVPLSLLGQMDALLKPGGRLILCSPYTWMDEVAEFAEWQETPDLDPADMVAGILKGRLIPQTGMAYRVLAEDKMLPWILRQQDRQASLFWVHLLAARKKKG